MIANRRLIVDFAARNRLPLMGATRAYVEDGALVSYANDAKHYFQRAASLVDRILRGAKPAKALGLTIPQSLLLRADKVIE